MRLPAIILLALLSGCSAHTAAGPSPVANETSQGGQPSQAAKPAPPTTPETATPDATAIPDDASVRNLSRYTDPKTGVSFQYPSVWKTSPGNSNYLPNTMDNTYGNPRASFEFSPKGNLYEKTNLSSLRFDYVTAPGKDLAGCTQRALGQGNQVPSHAVTIDGTAFQEFATGDAGMCHRVRNVVDVTYAAGQCLAFSRDFATICPDVEPGEQPLTDVQTRALQHHLDDVMQSVRIAR